jgi:hypothetical protein
LLTCEGKGVHWVKNLVEIDTFKHRENCSARLGRPLMLLAIVRYNYVSVEYVCGLSKRHIVGYQAEVPMVFLLQHTDPREQEGLAMGLGSGGKM